MKKLFVLLSAFIAINTAKAQGCLPEGITFTTQAQIDNFQANYPGCSNILGTVKIKGNDINNLNGLQSITSVGSNLLIGDEFCGNALLVDLSGLDNLKSVGKSLIVSYNSSLSCLSGLGLLEYIGQDLLLFGNPVLPDVTGLTNLDTINGNLMLAEFGEEGGYINNLTLESLTGLDHLNYIGRKLAIFGSFIKDMTGLGKLTSIGGNFEVFGNDSLVNFSGLENLNSIGGSLIIGAMWTMHSGFNPVLTSLDGLDTLVSIGGDLVIQFNDSLTSLDGLDNLADGSIKNLSISYNKSLSECHAQGICNYITSPNGIINIYDNAPGCNNVTEIAAGCGSALPCLPYGNYYFNSQVDIDNFQDFYPGCSELEGNVIIRGNDITNLGELNTVTTVKGNLTLHLNPKLSSINGLQDLTSVGGDLNIVGNYSLKNLSGLDALTTVNGSLIINGDTTLSSMEGLGLLKYIGGDFIVYDNNSLISLAGIEKLDSIGGFADILNNQNLISLNGMEALTSIGSWLRIAENSSLTSISGLMSLKTINGMLSVGSNNSLKSLSGLDNIKAKSIKHHLIISDNPALSTCEIRSICDFLASPNGEINIHGNAPGCISATEVRAACLVGLDEYRESGFMLYPNPANSLLTVSLSVVSPSAILTIHNLSGRAILRQSISSPITQLNIACLPAGMYFVKVSDSKGIRVEKLIKR